MATRRKASTASIEELQTVTLVGGNGADKSTTLRTISGLLHPRHGEIRFSGRTLQASAHMGSRRRAWFMCSKVGTSLGLTVEENLAMGAFDRRDRVEIAADQAMHKKGAPCPGSRPVKPVS
jgi:branched-chain amino acid transport system ATP-binding protein